jgi:hypothetical protein
VAPVDRQQDLHDLSQLHAIHQCCRIQIPRGLIRINNGRTRIAPPAP